MFPPGRTRNWSCAVSKVTELAAILLLLAGCTERKAFFLGPPFEGVALPISAVYQTNATVRVVLSGTMVEKCPVAGCWFVVRDHTGAIRVDTRNAGFVVVDVPLKTTVVVSGRVATNGSERFLDATSVRY